MKQESKHTNTERKNETQPGTTLRYMILCAVYLLLTSENLITNRKADEERAAIDVSARQLDFGHLIRCDCLANNNSVHSGM